MAVQSAGRPPQTARAGQPALPGRAVQARRRGLAPAASRSAAAAAHKCGGSQHVRTTKAVLPGCGVRDTLRDRAGHRKHAKSSGHRSKRSRTKYSWLCRRYGSLRGRPGPSRVNRCPRSMPPPPGVLYRSFSKVSPGLLRVQNLQHVSCETEARMWPSGCHAISKTALSCPCSIAPTFVSVPTSQKNIEPSDPPDAKRVSWMGCHDTQLTSFWCPRNVWSSFIVLMS